VSLLVVGESSGTVTIALDRPARGNALDATLVAALSVQIEACVARADVHTLVLHGAGGHFCTGFDLTGADTASDGELLLRFVHVEQLLHCLFTLPLRTVAYAHGRTWGAGADLFAACDVRVAHESATFRFPGAQFGLALGTRRLAERIGADAARRIVVEGATLDAEAALLQHLANERTDLAFSAWLATLAPPVVDRCTMAAINAATRALDGDRDLAALVRSAARPGLRDRIADYRARSRPPKDSMLQAPLAGAGSPIR
jgi:enoyl-CoA hydratase/carnithine racemase